MVRPKKPFEELSKIGQRSRLNFERHPERHERYKRLLKEKYRENKPAIQKKKSETQKKRQLEAMYMLGDKCEACGEKYNSKLKKTNLHLHHFYYDKHEKEKREKYGTIGETFRDVLNMAKRGENPKKKYTLLCQQCNALEGWIRKNPDKAIDAFGWCFEKGIIDFETPTPEGNKRIDEFIKKRKILNSK